MIRTTLWSPDTCTCKVEYSWDDAAPEDVRTLRERATNAAPQFSRGELAGRMLATLAACAEMRASLSAVAKRAVTSD